MFVTSYVVAVAFLLDESSLRRLFVSLIVDGCLMAAGAESLPDDALEKLDDIAFGRKALLLSLLSLLSDFLSSNNL